MATPPASQMLADRFEATLAEIALLARDGMQWDDRLSSLLLNAPRIEMERRRTPPLSSTPLPSRHTPSRPSSLPVVSEGVGDRPQVSRVRDAGPIPTSARAYDSPAPLVHLPQERASTSAPATLPLADASSRKRTPPSRPRLSLSDLIASFHVKRPRTRATRSPTDEAIAALLLPTPPCTTLQSSGSNASLAHASVGDGEPPPRDAQPSALFPGAPIPSVEEHAHHSGGADTGSPRSEEADGFDLSELSALESSDSSDDARESMRYGSDDAERDAGGASDDDLPEDEGAEEDEEIMDLGIEGGENARSGSDDDAPTVSPQKGSRVGPSSAPANSRRQVRNPKKAILMSGSPLGVFSNQLFALARPDVQRRLGALYRTLLDGGRGSPVSPAPVHSRSYGQQLEELAQRYVAAASTSDEAHLEAVLVSVQVAALHFKRFGSEDRDAGEAVSSDALFADLAKKLPLDGAQLSKVVSEGQMWARWILYGGIPLVVVLSILIRLPTLVSNPTWPFHELVLQRTKNGHLLREIAESPEQHPYPYAVRAFADYLHPTLRTLAAEGPVHLPFLELPSVVWSAEPLRAGEKLAPHFWLGPAHKGRRSPTKAGTVADYLADAMSRRVLRSARALQQQFGLFESPAPAVPAELLASNLSLSPSPVPVDDKLRTLPGRASELVIALRGAVLPTLDASIDLYVQQNLPSTSLGRVELPAPRDVDLRVDRLGKSSVPANSTARATYERNRPTRFFLSGKEDHEARAGFNRASGRIQRRMQQEAVDEETKRALLHRLEGAFGGKQELITAISDTVADAPVVKSADDLRTQLKNGWALGREMTRLAIDDAVVVVPSPADDSQPLIVSYPPNTIPPLIQTHYAQSQYMLYPSALMHALGLICIEPECATCPAEPPISSEPSPYVPPRVLGSTPDDKQLETLLKGNFSLEDVEVVPKAGGLRAPKVKGGSGEWSVPVVVQLAAHRREGAFVTFDLATWPPFKYGERWEEEEDEYEGLVVTGGTGNGNGALWHDATWTAVLGHLGRAYGERNRLFWSFQQALLARNLPAQVGRLRAGLGQYDGDGDGEPIWPAPWSAAHPNCGGRGAQMAVHPDDDRLDTVAAVAHFGSYTGGDIVFPEMLLAVGGGGGSLDFFIPSQALHGTAAFAIQAEDG